MEAAHALDAGRSALAQFRVGRQLPVREAASRAGLTEDEVTWLEEGRVYRFRAPDDAMLALLLYATALGIDVRRGASPASRFPPSRRRPTRGRA
jgi:transcriptional regulator with XRE-family HTH domain